MTPQKFPLITGAALILFGLLAIQVAPAADNLSRYEYFRILMGTKMRIVLYAVSEEWRGVRRPLLSCASSSWTRS